MDHLLRDIHHAGRSLLRTPGFALIAVLTLALGIGANTAIFSIVNGVLLRPLPYPQPQQLMFLTSRFPTMGFDQFWVSPPEFFEFRELNQAFASVGAFTTGELNLMAGERPVRVRGAAVSDDLLDHAGRLAGPGTPVRAGRDQRQRRRQLVILSHELWQAALGGAADRRPDRGPRRRAPRGDRRHAAQARRAWTTTSRSGCRSASTRPIARIAAATSSTSSGG